MSKIVQKIQFAPCPPAPPDATHSSNQRFPGEVFHCSTNQCLVAGADAAVFTNSPSESHLKLPLPAQSGADSEQAVQSATPSDSESHDLATTIGTTGPQAKVHSRNPRAGLPPGVSPIARADQKLMLALTYLLLWHFTTARQLSSACRFDPGFPGELVRRGFLKKVTSEFLKSGGVLMLSSSGLERALECQPTAVEYNLRSDSLISYQRHHMATQRVIQALAPATYLPERLIGIVDRSGEKRPDVIAKMKDARTVFVEVELTPKSGGRELDQALLKVVRAIESGRCDSVYYFSHNEGLLQSYAAALEKEIVVWEYCNARWRPVSKRQVTPEVRAKIHFKYVKNLLVNL